MNIINLCWWRGSNLGDELSPFIVDRVSKVIFQHEIQILPADEAEKNKYVCIGSMINEKTLKPGTEFWGSGVVTPERVLSMRNKKFFPVNRFLINKIVYKQLKNRVVFHAVRGPLSQSLLLGMGFHCPHIYGDPGLLAPLCYTPSLELQKTNDNEKIGLILHHSQYELLDKIRAPLPEEIKIIDIRGKGERMIKKLIGDIMNCKFVFSSSLHGIVLAQAYGKRAQWFKLKNHPTCFGDVDFKYIDYFSGTNQIVQEPIICNDISDIFGLALKILPPMVMPIDAVQKRLLNAFPFKN